MTIPAGAVRMGTDDSPTWEAAAAYQLELYRREGWKGYIQRTRRGTWEVLA